MEHVRVGGPAPKDVFGLATSFQRDRLYGCTVSGMMIQFDPQTAVVKELSGGPSECLGATTWWPRDK